jgi:hypothetical protein
MKTRGLAATAALGLTLAGCAPHAEPAPLPTAQYLKIDCANPETRIAIARGLDRAAGAVVIRHTGVNQEHEIHAGDGAFATTQEPRTYPAGTQFAALGEPYVPGTWVAIRAGELELSRHGQGWHNAGSAITAICANYDPHAEMFGITVPVTETPAAS